jgi:hypothetical protein
MFAVQQTLQKVDGLLFTGPIICFDELQWKLLLVGTWNFEYKSLSYFTIGRVAHICFSLFSPIAMGQ